MSIINKMEKTIDVDHTCDAISIYFSIGSSLPTYVEYESESFSDRERGKIKDKVIKAMEVIRESQVSKSSDKGNGRLTQQELHNKKERDFQSMIRYIAKIMKIENPGNEEVRTRVI